MNPIFAFILNVVLPLIIADDSLQAAAAGPIAGWLRANLSNEDSAIAKFLRLLATELEAPATVAAVAAPVAPAPAAKAAPVTAGVGARPPPA